MDIRDLTQEQKSFYQKNGYLLGLPLVFNEEEVKELSIGYQHLVNLFSPGQDTKEIREWHESSLFLYNICAHPQIVNDVSGILGPNFYLWASNFFAKASHTSRRVGWHQDARYWPLHPHNSVTVWLAFTNVDAQNGAMQVILASHRSGIIKHQRSETTDSVLSLELEEGVFEADKAVSLSLKAGEVSLHDDDLIHGAPANHPNGWRIGLIIRYSGTNVKYDLSVNPHFRTHLVSGLDDFQYNPIGVVPQNLYGGLRRAHKSLD